MASKKNLLFLLDKELKLAGYPGLKGKKLFLLRRNHRHSFENLLSELKVKKGDLIGNCEGGNILVHEILWNQQYRHQLPYLEIKDINGDWRCGCCPVSPPRTYEEIYEEQKEFLEEFSPNLYKHGFPFFNQDGTAIERKNLEKTFKPILPNLAKEET